MIKNTCKIIWFSKMDWIMIFTKKPISIHYVMVICKNKSNLSLYDLMGEIRVLVKIITICWLTKSSFWLNIIIKIITICCLTKSYFWVNIDNQNIISMIHNIYCIPFLWDLIWSYTSFKFITMLWHFKCIYNIALMV